MPVADSPIPLAGGSVVNAIEIGHTMIYKAPEGTVGIRIIIGSESNSVWSLIPKSVVVYRNKAKLTRALVEGNGRREVPIANINYANNHTYNNGFCFRVRKGFSYCMNTEFVNSGTSIAKLQAVSRNIPQSTGYNIYNSTTETSATLTKGFNFIRFDRFNDGWTDPDWSEANKNPLEGETWGFVTFVSDSANCSFTNIKVYEIDPYSSAGNWSIIMDPTIKGIARSQNYTTVNVSNLPKYDLMTLAPFEGYGSSTAYKSTRLAVTPGQFIKVVFDGSQPRSTKEFAWFTELDTPVAMSSTPIVPGTSAFSSISVATEHEDGNEFYFQVPEGAKYLFIYEGVETQSYPYTPFYLGLSTAGGGGNASSTDEKADAANAIVAKRYISQGLSYPLTPVGYTIPTDANGWELPQTVQQLNAIKKALQCINIRWTPKKNITGKNITYTANVEHATLPYSSTFQKEKTVGTDISFHTFMTAVNNQYSLLYTENIKKETSASAWGEVYYGGNGPVYYAQVCCSFTAFVTGRPSTDNNPDYPRSAALFNTFCLAPERKNADTWQIGDVIDNFYHSMLVYGLKRDSNGHVIRIKAAESTSSSTFDGNRFREFTPEDLYTWMDNHHTDSPHQVYRLTNFYPNIKYEPSPYVPLTEYGETASTITYNNDICCFAGDKAEFMEGDRVAINYNLTSTPSHTWTAIEVYKDDTLYNTYTLANIDQSALHTSQKNHALDLGKTLPAGSYKARMKDASSNYSDYTYWEVLADTFTITNNQDGSWSFSADPSTPITFLWIGTLDVATDLGSFYQRFAREPDWKEKIDNSVIVYIDKTLRDWGREDPVHDGTHARILVKGQYGTAVKVKPIPGRV